MKLVSARKEPFVLDREAFNCLLTALHPDRRPASEEYERLRGRLVRFFDWQDTTESEQLADTCLDRLAMKLYRGEQILDLRNYLHGIARMVLREWRNQRQRRQMLIDRATRGISEAVPEPDSEELYQVLEKLLEELPSVQRGLLLRYYSATSHAEQVSLRLQMAEEIGISANALRNRMLRLRIDLERSALKKLSREEKGLR